MDNLNDLHLPDIDLDQASVSETELTAWRYDPYKPDHLHNLLNTSSYEGRVREAIERDIDNEDMGEDEYYALLNNLQDAQVDRITSGMMYGAGDIKKHMKAHVFIAEHDAAVNAIIIKQV